MAIFDENRPWFNPVDSHCVGHHVLLGVDSFQGSDQSAAQDPKLGIFYDYLPSRHGDSFGKLDASGFWPPSKAHSGIF